MSWWSTVRSVADALGIWQSNVQPLGCELGRIAFRESRRSAQIANLTRRPRPLQWDTISRLGLLFPDLDLSEVRIRTRCRLPPNRFREGGSIYAMTFGKTVFWRDELDEDDPHHLVKLIHELVHVDQVRRHGGESSFACAYGIGYVEGGGQLPGFVDDPNAYHRNPLEAEAYSFEAQFRDDEGRVLVAALPARSAPA